MKAMELQAKWHKSCRNKFSDLKISRQEKRKHTSEVEEESRQSCGESSRTMTAGCFSVVMYLTIFTMYRHL